MTLSMQTLDVRCYYAEPHFVCIVMLIAIMLNAVMLNAIMLNVVMLGVIMLRGVGKTMLLLSARFRRIFIAMKWKNSRKSVC